ncbi:hypothetical protein [Clostridium sp. LIBA-8841]|uniref:hypothetical protein n=1 Tax=Clostridium sp. LIBA-8841 TaxID=2987530 RepID=UPI002AC3A97A|nr:hypothetical protein [Clostridium sp. LIBA-8841]MDZ5252431.1 hypothetical protein [Clostridium sp. LIBA-8841]
MIVGFFIALIFMVMQVGIVSYLVYNLYSKNEEAIKSINEEDVKSAFNLRKVVVLENSVSLLFYGVLISDKEILHFGRGELLTVAILASIGVMMVYLYMFDNFIEKVKKFNENKKENIIA